MAGIPDLKCRGVNGEGFTEQITGRRPTSIHGGPMYSCFLGDLRHGESGVPGAEQIECRVGH